MEGSLDKLAAAYWAGSDEAGNQVDHAIMAGGPDAVLLLECLAKRAPNDEALGSLGAGEMENLVRMHGFELMDELDAALSREPRLRAALYNVRVGTEELPSDVNFRPFYLGREADEP